MNIQNLHLAAFFLDVWLKSLVVLVLAGGASLAWRRGAAATRYLIWFLALASLPFVPPLASVVPSWQKPLWSVSSDLVSGNQVSLAVELGQPAAQTFPRTNTGPGSLNSLYSRFSQNRPSQVFAARFSRNWLPLGFAVWCGGVVLALAYLIFGQVQLRNISRKAQPLSGNDWARLLNEACETLRIGRPVTLLQSPDSVMPLTWGWLKPVVLLPAEAEQWPEGRKRIVLLHELAHIKRRDCLTQWIAQVICALYWFNPLVWLAARRMRVEREQACDDLVLNGGCKATEYAGHLVEIASSFRRVPQAAAIAMARRSGLENRVAAIVDASRVRRLRPATVWALLILGSGMLVCVCGWSHDLSAESADEASLRQQQLNQLESFSTAKFEQAKILMAADGQEVSPEYDRFFQAATNGDWRTVTNMFDSFKERHPQYARKPGTQVDTNLSTSCWQPALELCLAYDAFGMCDPKYNQIYADEIINSIPPGSIYFGGTDPGRGLPTAFSKSQINADPFYTLTQNALANGNYLDYLRSMYGGKIYIPTHEDAEKCFNDYYADAQKRFENHQLKPGEDVSVSNGKTVVSGQVAVMSINGLIAKVIFDQNSNYDFYVEESFPLDWMYPYLEPHGLIMKINREPLDTLSDDIVQQDRDYWTKLITPMIGDWLNENTSVSDIAAFADKVFGRHDFSGFTGDPEFVLNAYSHVMFSKERSSIAALYAWRAKNATDPAEKQRMNDAADFAFRQAWALGPSSSESVFRYVDLLVHEKRISDALLIAQTAANVMQANGTGPGQFTATSEPQLQDLIRQLQKMQQQEQ